MSHIVLLGDSVFDNARYVPGDPPVTLQIQRALSTDWKVTLLAVDGHVIQDVASQLKRMPGDATHLFISVGGNDALGMSYVLNKSATTVGAAVERLRLEQEGFHANYENMLRLVAQHAKPTVVCTIYDSVPNLPPAAKTALGLFNDVILRAAIMARLPVVDLRFVCDSASDYSTVSPIEPSARGGEKIAHLVTQIAMHHDFSQRNCVVYRE